MCPKFNNSWSELERYIHVDTVIVYMYIHDRGNWIGRWLNLYVKKSTLLHVLAIHL